MACVTAAALWLGLLAAAPAAAQYELRGWVFDPDGLRTPGIVVRALDQPAIADVTDAEGGYVLVLPGPAVWRIEARGDGYAPQWAPVDVAGPTQRNFWLLPQVIEGFESGDFSAQPWQGAGNVGWAAVSESPFEGLWCARSGNVDNLQTSILRIPVEVAQNGEIAFRLRVSSEDGYDGLAFAVDGQEVGFWSGEVGWVEQVFPVPAGSRLLAWTWRKDEAVTLGEDAAWIDGVRFPPLATPPVPQLSLGFGSLLLRAQQGAVATRLERIGNTGQVPLEFRLDLVPPVIGGGPDGAGYTWTSSDLAGGPTYQWIDLIGTGQIVVPPEDEAVWGPFDLGFDFPFYGAVHDRVWICANGFLSFGDALGDYRNLGLPDTTSPNGLVAPFWDDLDPSAGGLVLWRRDVLEQRFIVQWHSLPHFSFSGTGPPETFQAILHADGRIRFQYAVVSVPDGCSVGIEDAEGLVGLQVARDESFLHAALAVLIRPAPALPWISATPASGAVPPGSSQLVAFTCDAESLALGSHFAAAILSTNDPEALTQTIPLELQVVSDLTGVAALAGPEAALLAPRPNPANPVTSLSIRLAVPAEVTLRLHDAAGRLVRTLVRGELPAGEHAFVWDGRDGRGRPAASGIYLARLSWAGGREVRRVVLVR